MFEIAEKKQLSHTVSLFRIKAPQIAKKRKAGQFIIIRLNEHGERIPLTIVDSFLFILKISLKIDYNKKLN